MDSMNTINYYISFWLLLLFVPNAHAYNEGMNSIISDIYVSSSNIEELKTIDLSNKKFFFVDDILLESPLKLSNVCNLVIDGLNHSIKCCNGFLVIENGCKIIEVKNIKADGNGKGYFLDMPSTPSIKTNINIHHNTLSDFSVGISFNADLAGLVENSRISNNIISNILGTEPGSGYGIHLANVRNCIINNNNIQNVQRHSIYHAWGMNNEISNNVIKNHRRNLEFSASKCALAIFRNSRNVTIKENTFENNNSVSVFVYAGFDGETVFDKNKYADQKDIKIIGNYFINNCVDLNPDAIGIMIGYNIHEKYSDFIFHEKNIDIQSNFFFSSNTRALNAIRLYTGNIVKIKNNIFMFDLKNQEKGNIVSIYSNYEKEAKFFYSFKKNSFFSRSSKEKSQNVFYIPEKNLGLKKIVFEKNYFSY